MSQLLPPMIWITPPAVAVVLIPITLWKVIRAKKAWVNSCSRVLNHPCLFFPTTIREITKYPRQPRASGTSVSRLSSASKKRSFHPLTRGRRKIRLIKPSGHLARARRRSRILAIILWVRSWEDKRVRKCLQRIQIKTFFDNKELYNLNKK